jgi:hypothetical protein
MGDAENVLAGGDPMAGGAPPTMPPPVAPQVTPTPQPAPVAQPATAAPDGSSTDPEMYAAAVHHSRLAGALNDVANILGGNKSLHLQKNPDGSVSVTQTDATPGEKWGRVAQAALAGAAKGFAVGQGPGGAQRAAAASVAQGMAMPQAQQDQTLATAAKYNDQNQQRLMLNANIAYLNQRNLQQSWQLGQDKTIAAEHEEDRESQFQQLVKQRHMIDVGPAADVEEAAKTYNTNSAVQQAITGQSGQLVIHHSATGPPHAWILPDDQMTKLNPNEQQGFHYNVDLSNNTVTKTPYSIAANTEDGQHTAFRIANENAEQLNAAKVAIEGKKTQAAIDAAQNKPGPSYVLGNDRTTGAPVFYNPRDPTAAPIPANVESAGTAGREQAAQTKANDLQEKTMGPARDAINYANDYLHRGVFTGTSDEGLQEKFFELAKPSSGFKMTKPQMDMLRDSQDAMNSVVAKTEHMFTPNAPWFSPKLRQDIVGTMNDLARSHPAIAIDANGRASLNPVTIQRPASTAAPTGTTGIPNPIAPARPGGTIPTTMNGQPGTLDATGNFTPAAGGPSTQLPGRNVGAPLPAPKVGDVVQGRTYLGGNPALRTSWR